MKKVVAVLALLLVLSFASAAIVSAQAPTQPNWRFYLKADDGNGMNAMAAMTIGVQSGAKDGYGPDGTASDSNDSKVNVPSTKNTRGVMAVLNGTAWVRDIKSPRIPNDPAYGPGMPGPNGHTFGDPGYPPYHKIWDLRVFCLPIDQINPSGTIRLSFMTVVSSVLPPATLPDMDGSTTNAKYMLVMRDNKGVSGAPANGTSWDIPAPTVLTSNTPWYTLTLPLLSISASNADAAMAEGYQMQFYQYQEPVPEPGSLMALASGIMGLAGYAIRRRK